MFPGMVTSPPLALPVMKSGGLPFADEHFAPIDSNASKRGCIGLCLRLSSPESTVFPSDRAAIAEAIRMVVPEFDASISEGDFTSLIPFIVRLELSCIIVAPKLLHADMVALVSREYSTFLITLFPSASDAKKIALCV